MTCKYMYLVTCPGYTYFSSHVVRECGLDSSVSEYGPLPGSCEYGSGPFGNLMTSSEWLLVSQTGLCFMEFEYELHQIIRIVAFYDVYNYRLTSSSRKLSFKVGMLVASCGFFT
jgi:hypothetical protein